MLDSISYRRATLSLMSKQIRIGRSSIIIGVARCFGLGFHIDRYSVSIDIGPFYIALEY
jgi:hypothetical protein